MLLLAAADPSLVGHWRFDDCRGTDASGNERHAKVVGQPNCVGRANGKALVFNAPGHPPEHLLLPELPAVFADGMTMCAWASPEGAPRNFERFVDLNDGASGEGGGMPVLLGRLATSDDVIFETWSTTDPTNRDRGRLVAAHALKPGLHFYCATDDKQGAMRIYVDGVLAAKRKGQPVANVVRRHGAIGRSAWSDSDPDFAGLLDDVRIYSRALADVEIRKLYSAER